MNDVDEIEYSGDLKLDIKNYVKEQKPVVVRGAFRSSKYVQKWGNPDYLCDKLDKLTVQYKKSDSKYFPDPNSLCNPELFEIHESSFVEYFKLATKNKVEGDLNYFLSGNELSVYRNGMYNDSLFSILDDVELPNCIDQGDLSEIGIWLTGREISSCLHYDRNGCGNINVQVVGEKSFIIISPSEYSSLDMFKSTEPNPFFNFSKIKPADIETIEQLNSYDFKYSCGTLCSSDCLYIPPLWVHKFDHLGDYNLNLTFWWKHDFIPINKLSLNWALGTAFMKMAWNKSKNLSSQEFNITELYDGAKQLGSGIESLSSLEDLFAEWQ